MGSPVGSMVALATPGTINGGTMATSQRSPEPDFEDLWRLSGIGSAPRSHLYGSRWREVRSGHHPSKAAPVNKAAGQAVNPIKWPKSRSQLAL